MLTLVPTPIGNIADISLRAMDALSSAKILLCEDTRVTKKLLHILQERYNLTRHDQEFIFIHSHNENDFLKKITPEFFDKNVVYVSDAGMPGVSDPAQLLIDYCIRNGVKYDVLPGANALLSAFVASGFITTQFLFFGFLPHKGKDRHSALLNALFNGYTTILYESPHRLCKLLEEIEQEAPNRTLFLAKEISKKYQKFYKGEASLLKEQIGIEVRGEWVVVIEAGVTNSSGISENDILSLDISKKVAAKLISQISGENSKAVYQRLIK